MAKKPKIGVFKFTGCAGCQMEILRMEDEFLDLIKLFDICYWKMAKRNNVDKDLDIALIEGGIYQKKY
jgi:coenzyme F420-reducing hydrogenase gamma subunit